MRPSGEDASAVREVVGGLIRMRHLAGLSQREVAERMGVSQSTVSQFESEAVDPRVSTVQRYARAVGAVLRFEAEAPPREH